MTWLPVDTPDHTGFDRVLGLRPDLRDDFSVFTDLLWTRGGLDPALLELCRRRIAQMHGCETERPRIEIESEKIAALDQWRTAESFSPAERACIDLAEKFVLDPRAVSDADVAALRAYLSPAQTVALIEALAVFDGFTRFRAMLAVACD